MERAFAASRVAVIGAGIAGAACAQALHAAGLAVHAFDNRAVPAADWPRGVSSGSMPMAGPAWRGWTMARRVF